MTKERFLKAVETLKKSDDLYTFEYDGVLHLTFNDDDDTKELENLPLYEELEDFLGDILEWDFYGVGEFEGIKLHVGYSSYDD
jgi:hypothetical protein